MNNTRNQNKAFTLIELVVIVAAIAMLAACSLPALAGTRPQAQRLMCADNLRQVAQAFRTWGISHHGYTPMTVQGTVGGNSDTGDIGTHIVRTPITASHGVCKFFYTLQNQLTTPKILFCPAEYDTLVRTAATTFTVGAAGQFLSDLNCSYFVGIDESESFPRMLLAGDHNMGLGTATAPPTIVYGVQNVLGLGPWPANGPAWTAQQHNAQGNVAMADGSVECFSTAKLQSALNNSGDTISHWTVTTGGTFAAGQNRLQFPQTGGAGTD